MNEKLQNDLIKAYPKIFKNVGGDETKTCMAHGIQCNDGWYDLLDTLCYTMQRHCNVTNTRYIIETDKYEFVEEGDPEYVQVVAAQVKEKLGTLRFYVDGADDSTEAMIQMAEQMSGRICELCGNPAKTSRDSGWMHTTCTVCNKTIRDTCMRKRLEEKGWKSGSAEEFLTDSNPDNNPDKVSEQFSQEMSQEMWDSLNQELWDRRTEMTEMKIVIAKLQEVARDTLSQEVSQEVSQLEDTDSAAFQSHCHSCGVPWASHMGIAGTCAENAKLRKGIEEAKQGKFSKNPPKIKATKKKKKK
jgi:hypothetical protein